MKLPFLISALPRSGTAWLSCAMSFGDIYCHHELSGKCATIDELAERMAGCGNSEPCGALVTDRIFWHLPLMSVIYIIRDPEECLESFARVASIEPDSCRPLFAMMSRRFLALRQNIPGLEIGYRDLCSMDSLIRIWKHVTKSDRIPAQHFEKMLTLRVAQDSKLIQNAALQNLPGLITDILNERDE